MSWQCLCALPMPPLWTAGCGGCMPCCWSSWPESGAFSLAHIPLDYIPSCSTHCFMLNLLLWSKANSHHLPVCLGPEEEITWTEGICFLTAPLQECTFHMLRSFFLSLPCPGELLIFGRSVYSGSVRKHCGEVWIALHRREEKGQQLYMVSSIALLCTDQGC